MANFVYGPIRYSPGLPAGIINAWELRGKEETCEADAAVATKANDWDRDHFVIRIAKFQLVEVAK